MKEGDALNVNGVPAVFVNGEQITGAIPIEYVYRAVDDVRTETVDVPAIMEFAHQKNVPIGGKVKLTFEATQATGQKVPEWNVVK